MNSWLEDIVDRVSVTFDKPVVVEDSQEYFSIKEIREAVLSKGYEIEIIKPAFNYEVRLAFESKARNKTHFILVVMGEYEPLDDIKQASAFVRLNSKDFFRNFDKVALKGLNFDALSELYKINIYKTLSYFETCDFISKDKGYRRLIAERLLNCINEKIKIIDNRYSQWFEIISKLGELGSLVYELQIDEIENKYSIAVERLNERFQNFIDNTYESLFTLSGIRQPVTIDKIQDYIANNSKNSKIAFVVIDGMNFWQWSILKHNLEKEGLHVKEKASFSWLPSITAWARQAIFKGKRPDISTGNQNENKLFCDYWLNKGLQSFQISYNKIDVGEKLQIPNSNIKIAGFVYNALDEMMHGSVLGNKQLYNSTVLWIKESGICDSIKDLKNDDFDIYISTDHGNIDATLNCKITAGEKTVSLTRSKRFIKFDNEQLADEFIKKNCDFKLGKRGTSVYCRDYNGFGTSGQREITHGGSHILELIIPVGIIK